MKGWRVIISRAHKKYLVFVVLYVLKEIRDNIFFDEIFILFVAKKIPALESSYGEIKAD